MANAAVLYVVERALLWLLIVGIIAVVCLSVWSTVQAQTIPERCWQYQPLVLSQAHEVIGPGAPTAVLGAQIQQESWCRPNVSSGVGAQGLTQFMPKTAAWMAELYPDVLWPADPGNPTWAVMAQVRYMHRLVPDAWATPGDTWAAKLSSYNGGFGWILRDQRQCRALEWCNPNRWWGNVEDTPDGRRAPANIRQNREYVERILRRYTPAYIRAGYGTGVEWWPAARPGATIDDISGSAARGY